MTLVLQKFHYTYTNLFHVIHDFESSCHFYFKNSWNVSILSKLRHEQILYNYNYVDFSLCMESAGNGSCHWVYMYIHVLLIKQGWTGVSIDVLTSLGQYIKTSVWDFPVMTEWTRLISYLLNGPEPAIDYNQQLASG